MLPLILKISAALVLTLYVCSVLKTAKLDLNPLTLQINAEDIAADLFAKVALKVKEINPKEELGYLTNQDFYSWYKAQYTLAPYLVANEARNLTIVYWKGDISEILLNLDATILYQAREDIYLIRKK